MRTPAESTQDQNRISGFAVVKRGLDMSPAIKQGLGLTMLLAILSTMGGSVVPIVIQVTIDSGLGRGGNIDTGKVGKYLAVAGVLIAITAVCAYVMRVRLFTASERGLAEEIAEEKRRRWLEESREAIAWSNDYVEKNGLPLARYCHF